MEKGQLRAEPNISIRRPGAIEFGVKTELKNINSFRALHRAILYEVNRQQQVLESGDAVVQETRGWSEQEERTFAQRSKEFAEDYRYFPEPDLPPLELDRAWIEELRRGLPDLPSVRRARLLNDLPAGQVAVIAADRELADLYESAVAKGAPTVATANWIVNEVAPTGKLPSPENLAELMKLLQDGAITRDNGREVYLESVETGRTPAEIVAEHGYRQVSDESELRVIAEAVIDANPKAAADYRAGKKQAMQALMADLRKRVPHANPKVANELLLKLLA
jgi:aspartyl-tRNA(Asn)/glutamyl-tRNA(Gln) amidotransferase subunit B